MRPAVVLIDKDGKIIMSRNKEPQPVCYGLGFFMKNTPDEI